jgi:hypothetical protein
MYTYLSQDAGILGDDAVPNKNKQQEVAAQRHPAWLVCGVWWAIASCLGVGLHYVYEWSGCMYVLGFVVPVNESVFEHAKLFTLPLIICWSVDGSIRNGRQIECHLLAMLAAILCSVSLMLVVHLTAAIFFSFENVVFDIMLFLGAMLAAQAVGLACLREIQIISTVDSAWTVVALVAVCLVHMFCTDHAPRWPQLFEDHLGFYGRPSKCG